MSVAESAASLLVSELKSFGCIRNRFRIRCVFSRATSVAERGGAIPCQSKPNTRSVAQPSCEHAMRRASNAQNPGHGGVPMARALAKALQRICLVPGDDYRLGLQQTTATKSTTSQSEAPKELSRPGHLGTTQYEHVIARVGGGHLAAAFRSLQRCACNCESKLLSAGARTTVHSPCTTIHRADTVRGRCHTCLRLRLRFRPRARLGVATWYS